MRNKWLQLFSPVAISKIVDSFNANPFMRESRYGFTVSSNTRKSVNCRYTERIVTTEVINDPFGSEEVLETTRYDNLEFSLIDIGLDFFLLEMNNPGRSVKRFLEALYSTLGFGTAIKPIILDVSEIVNRLRKTRELRLFKVSRVRATGIVLSNSSSARVEAVSNADAMKELGNFFDLTHASIERASVTFTVRGIVLEGEISRTGLMSYPEEAAPTFVEVVVGYLRDSGKKAIH